MVDFQDDEGDGLADREMPNESDVDASDDSVDTYACPACRKAVYEDADVCPHCGEFVIPDSPRRRLPLWVIGLLIGCVILVVVLGLR